MAILLVFHNFFRYYQNAEKVPFLQKFFVQYFVAYATGFTHYIQQFVSAICKQNALILSAIEIRPIFDFKALFSHCKNSRIILRLPLETLLGPLKSQIDGLLILPYFQKLGNFGLFCANCTNHCIIVVIQSSQL